MKRSILPKKKLIIFYLIFIEKYRSPFKANVNKFVSWKLIGKKFKILKVALLYYFISLLSINLLVVIQVNWKLDEGFNL